MRRGNHEDAEQLRRDLMQAAVDIVSEKGVSALTIRAVAERVGVATMTPYRYFADKTELLEGVWKHAFQELGATLEKSQAKARGGRARLRASINAFLQYWIEHKDYYALLFGFSSVTDAKRLDVSASPVYLALLKYQEAVTRAFADEIGAGMTHWKLAADTRLAMQLGYLHGTLVMTRYPWSDAETLRAAYVETIIDAVERCLKRPEPAAAKRKRSS